MLGSGSAGNATLLQSSGRGILIDAGLSYREICRRLAILGFEPDGVSAIVITHGHGDHTRGAALFSRRHGVPVYATDAVRTDWGEVEVASWRRLRVSGAHRISGLTFHPFAIPHDASETLAFRIETPEGAIGFATDIGMMTSDIADRFQGCRILVVESNHATELLRVSPYNRSTRERIGGIRGHLSNESLAAFIRADLGRSVRCLVLVHLSRVNNVPEIAEMTCREALVASGRHDVQVVVARQDRVAETVDLGLWSEGRGSRRPTAMAQSVLPFDGAVTSPGAHGAVPQARGATRQ